MTKTRFFGFWLPINPGKGYTFRIGLADGTEIKGITGIVPVNDKLISIHFEKQNDHSYHAVEIGQIIWLKEHRSDCAKRKGRKGGRTL